MSFQLAAPALLAGVLSAAIYFLSYGSGFASLFFFLSTLPIYWIGLGKRDMDALASALIACLLMALFINVLAALIYILVLGLPSWYISYQSLRSGSHQQKTIWFPLSVIYARLAAMSVFILLIVTLAYTGSEASFYTLIEAAILSRVEMLSDSIDAVQMQQVKTMVPMIAFVYASTLVWVWLGCLYLHSWVANKELARQKKAIRPNMRVQPFPPPNWMIPLLIITGLASLVGSPSLAFWGKVGITILLMPYFLTGAALIHEQVKASAHRLFILFFMYFLAFTQGWPALAIACYGIYHHVTLLNKYLSSGGNSSRS